MNFDVIIIGGGLGGLGLARQLTLMQPELEILIVERNQFPVPKTTAKVGESTVEIGSHYFSNTLRLQSHFKDQHLQKYGLRCFFGGANDDFAKYDELGVSQRFGIPTYQLERGVMENHLHDLLVASGVQILDGIQVQDIALDKAEKAVTVLTSDGQSRRYTARWMIDAAGRQGLLKKQLNLHKKSPHKGNAVWFRVDKTIMIDDWSEDAAWQSRLDQPGARWLSTNHLMGPGYWVWVIPLGSGATSIGIVMDDQAYEQADIHSYDEAIRWLSTNQPVCADALQDAKVLDFVDLRDYAFGCRKTISSEGWGILGEAGGFSDPFYSPGSDFIALGNEFISELISRDKKGLPIAQDSLMFQSYFSAFFANTLSLYVHQYGGFGDRRMMSAKLLWDYTFYWGILAQLFFKKTITNLPLMQKLNDHLIAARQYNAGMQAVFRERAANRIVVPNDGVFVDQYKVPCLNNLIQQLEDDSVDVRDSIAMSVDVLQQLRPILTDMLSDSPTTTVSAQEHALLGDYRKSVLA